MSSFTSALRDALLVPNRGESSDAVQHVVINQIRELDPRARIRTTGYFNHSWVPDLLLSWNDDERRSLFLRFDARYGFEDDLRFIGSRHRDPVFLDIAQPELALQPTADRGAVEPIDLGESEAMLTEHEAWSQLSAGIKDDADVRTATKHLIRGGQGLVDENVAQHLVANYRAVNEMLQEDRVASVAPDGLRDALNMLEEPLSRIARLDLEKELRHRWVQAGRDPELFPSLEGWQLHDRAPDEIAALVMALVSGSDPVPDHRWEEISDAITADALGVAARDMPYVTGGKLNDLVRVARDKWTAKWAWVPPATPDAAQTLDWSLGRTSLEIRLENQRAVFADLGNRFNTMQKPEELPTLEPRLDALNHHAVVGISLSTSEEVVGLQLRATATESLGERLRKLMAEQAAVRSSGRINRLQVRVPGTSSVIDLNFETGKASCPDPVRLSVFARVVARFMVNVAPEVREAMERQLGRDDTL
jgi:hypothetical protein